MDIYDQSAPKHKIRNDNTYLGELGMASSNNDIELGLEL